MGGAERVDETGSVTLGAADADAGAFRSARIESRLAARAPVGVAGRLALTKTLTHTLQSLSSTQRAMAVALLYMVAEESAQSTDQRVNVYLRWRLAFDASGPDALLQTARAHRQLRNAFTLAHERLSGRYSLEPIPDGALLARLRDLGASERVAELSFVATPSAGAPWPMPVHAQPALDLLLRQPRRAAIQFTVERRMNDALDEAPTLGLSVATLGAAARPEVIHLLARELCGCGVLATSRRPSAHAPRLHILRANTAAERAHITTNINGPAAAPWPQNTSSGTLALTDDQAALLLPLPFALFD